MDGPQKPGHTSYHASDPTQDERLPQPDIPSKGQPETLLSLPTHLRGRHQPSSPPSPCRICLTTPLNPPTRLTLPCTHAFCAPCLATWLDYFPTCPLCREPYPYTLYPTPLPSVVVGEPRGLTPTRLLVMMVLAILPPWILLILPTIFVLDCSALLAQPMSCFFRTAWPFASAFLWLWLLGLPHGFGLCDCAAGDGQRREKSTLEFVWKTVCKVFVRDRVGH